MKIFRIIGIVFLIVGVGLFAGAGIAYKITSSFVARSISATGTVTDLVLSSSMDDDGMRSHYYHPVISFQTGRGESIEFQSSTGSNPPAYQKGDTVLVLYDPESPQEARINSFFALWFLPTLFGGMGLIFGSIGGVFLGITIHSRRRDQWLMDNGRVIETDYKAVELNRAVRINSRHPYRILTQWLDPVTNTVHVFKSKDLFYDPTDYIQNRKIMVRIDPGNPKKHLMDISFLPKSSD